MLDQVLSIIGALMVLGAFAGNLMHRLDRDGIPYAALNVVGSGLLGYVALNSAAVGLIIIEFAWSFISLIALIRALMARDRAARV